MTEQKTTVTDEQISAIALKQWEIMRRFKEGTLPFALLNTALQNAIEGNFNGITDPRFELIKTGEVTVPKDYKHSKQLSTLNPKDFDYYNTDITDKNFKDVSNKLEAGKKYTVKIFQIKKSVSSDECIEFLRAQKAILVGAQGESLVWQQNKEIFLVGKYTVSFDEKKNLFKDADGRHRVPYVGRDSDGVWRFRLGFFEDGWPSGDCLLCLCDC